MGQTLVKVKGLNTYASEVTETPPGALKTALNCVIDRDSVIECRPGFLQYGTLSSTSSDRAKQLLVYQNTLIEHVNSTLQYDNAGTPIAYAGSYDPPSHGDAYVPKIHSEEMNSNFYFTSNNGIQKLDALTSTIRAAGVPQGLDTTLSLNSPSTGFLTNNTQVAYRVLWGYRDLNNNLILGAPGQRTVISNASGNTKDVIVNFSIPAEITTAYFYQVYRSSISAGVAIDPADDQQLVYESNPTSTDISNKFIQFVDSTPDSLRGATLYTNASQEGINQSNNRPPQAKDLAAFKNCLFFANTIQKQNKTITMLSAGGGSGVQLSDTITIAGTTYTAGNTENVGANIYLLSTGGTPAQNITLSAQSLCKVINRSGSNSAVYAYYLSNAGDLPGKIYVEARGLNAASFTITASANPQAWNPALPSAGTTITSASDTFQNYLYYSKTQQPESVPLLNFFAIGSANKPIYRIIALRDSLIILKQDGVYRLTGTSPTTFDVNILDNTVVLLAPESAQRLNNQIYAFTNQLITTITDTSTGVISRPIEDKIRGLNQLGNFQSTCFAIAEETSHRYLLFISTIEGNSFANHEYVYNTFTQSWTEWDRAATAGLVNPGDDKIYFTHGSANTILQQRKNNQISDFVDEDLAVTISAVSSNVVTLTSVLNLSIGDALTQSGLPFSLITAIDLLASTITLDVARAWSLADAVVSKHIASTVTWVPQFCSNPGILKQIREIQLLVKDRRFSSAVLGFQTNLVKSSVTVALTGFRSFQWGYFGWGRAPWGGSNDLDRLRTWIPATMQWCSWITVTFTHANAFGAFGIAGFDLYFNEATERTGT